MGSWTLTIALVFGSIAFAQPAANPTPVQAATSQATSQATSPATSGRMEGRVVADREGTPLGRVRVILHPIGAAEPATAVETDDQGAFIVRDIKPGTYSLSAVRDGYLESPTVRVGNFRMPRQFQVQSGQRLTGLEFRLQRWAVVSGRIRYEDGEPAVDIPVTLYHETHTRGQHSLQVAATVRTDDQGNYRAHGLSAGLYYLAAVIEPGQPVKGVEDQPRTDDSGNEISVRSYATMFYPDTTRLSEALPIRIGSGEDLGNIDLYLQQVQRVKLSGVITDGGTGQTLTGASIILERLDSANTGSLPAPSKVEYDAEGRFHIANVTPGRYQVWVDATEGKRRLVGRSSLLVTNADVEDLKLNAMPQVQWAGELTYAPGTNPAPQPFEPRVVLEPRGDHSPKVDVVAKNGRFDVNLMPDETYDVFIQNLPDGYFISQILVEGHDMRRAGLMSSFASNIPFQIVADSRGARIDGQVVGSTGDPWRGASLSLIPENSAGRLQDYREGFADTTGQFHITGIAPGRYILTAWFDQPPCDIYDSTSPEALDPCRASGTSITIEQGAIQTILLKMKVP